MTPLARVRSSDEKLQPLERLEAPCDPDSLQLVRSAVLSRRMGSKAREGDGVVGATGRVDGYPVACFARDPSYLGGSLGEAQADTICRVLDQAGRARVPVVGLIVVMTKDASMFLTGPGVVREVTGEQVDGVALGGPKVHERNGVCRHVVDFDLDAAWFVRDLLDYLPQHAGMRSARRPTVEPASTPAAVPDEERKVYDVREFPGGALNADAACKAARFVNACDAPLVVLVDTPGCLPGRAQGGRPSRLEARACVRRGVRAVPDGSTRARRPAGRSSR